MPPDWMPAAPDVASEWLWIWRAWWRLHQDRPWRGGGFGPSIPGRIPWRAVVKWCAFHDLQDGAADFMDKCFEAMDSVFMDHHAARVRAAQTKT